MELSEFKSQSLIVDPFIVFLGYWNAKHILFNIQLIFFLFKYDFSTILWVYSGLRVSHYFMNHGFFIFISLTKKVTHCLACNLLMVPESNIQVICWIKLVSYWLEGNLWFLYLALVCVNSQTTSHTRPQSDTLKISLLLLFFI